MFQFPFNLEPASFDRGGGVARAFLALAITSTFSPRPPEPWYRFDQQQERTSRAGQADQPFEGSASATATGTMQGRGASAFQAECVRMHELCGVFFGRESPQNARRRRPASRRFPNGFDRLRWLQCFCRCMLFLPSVCDERHSPVGETASGKCRRLFLARARSRLPILAFSVTSEIYAHKLTHKWEEITSLASPDSIEVVSCLV